jgi:Tfp pilus assembly protein PilV
MGELCSRANPSNGFALISSLMLMILIVVIAVGMLTLSGRSLSIVSRKSESAEARAAARLALALAINQLQVQTGPDQRITAPADQLTSSASGDQSAADENRRQWTGVYDSWPAAATTRPAPSFRGWLVSGDPDNLANIDTAKSNSGGTLAQLVDVGTVGDRRGAKVSAPMLTVAKGSLGSTRIAWWVGDEGIKASIPSPAPATGTGSSDKRLTLQAAPSQNVSLADYLGSKPFATLDPKKITINQKAITWGQSALIASETKAIRPFFHDLTTHNRGLITNVRKGGFRRDLSFYLETPQATLPRDPLYTVGGKEGISMTELWTHYNVHKALKTGASFAYTTGGRIDLNTPYLQIPETQAQVVADPFYFYKQHAFIRCQTILSFFSKPVGTAATPSSQRYRLHLVADPVVTIWNPLDVPISVSPSWNSIKFWHLPYDFIITLGGQTKRYSFKDMVGGEHHYLTLRVGGVEPIILRPGEVLVYSQGPNTPIGTGIEKSGLDYINGRAGWNYGGGTSWAVGKGSPRVFLEGNGTDSFTYKVEPNSLISSGSKHWSLTHHEIYYKEDRNSGTPNAPGGTRESVSIGGIYIDSIYGQPYTQANPKPASLRIRAANYPDFFGKIKEADTRPYSLAEVSNSVGRGKAPFMLFTFAVKSESASEKPGRFLARFNPKALITDLSTLKDPELAMIPYEVQIRPLTSWFDRTIDVSNDGSGYFGGGWTAQSGVKSIITHSVPREPLTSLAAFQHSFANGAYSSYNHATPGSAVYARNILLPQVSHPIGNSLAPSVIAHNSTESSLDGRQLADHSYLANQALWDDWFLSGIAPQSAATFSTRRGQMQVAEDFLNNKDQLPQLPVRNYRPNLEGRTAQQILTRLFSGSAAHPSANTLAGSLIAVDGMFNVNSTSVDAWKAMFAGLKGQSFLCQNRDGTEITASDTADTPVIGLHSPLNEVATPASLSDIRSANQWTGRRTFTDSDIEALAKALVREIRKRGPFLSLADFVNRRVDYDKNLAKAGALQSALDADDVPINRAYNGARAVAIAAPGVVFTEAELGGAAYGIPGMVKQADVLTPIAPVLSARSDSFVIRAYGEKLDPSGKVVARAWCEATVRRDASYVDPANEPEELPATLNTTNKSFGRRYQVISFRWLQPNEV